MATLIEALGILLVFIGFALLVAVVITRRKR